ncbi:hypothetical protein MesoLjLa_19180 [Mesorhizobium sp. L-2-11]|nr:hypothetical protein MesoLjLa_19180 [Mesorhizobium sp. L-2-11]
MVKVVVIETKKAAMDVSGHAKPSEVLKMRSSSRANSVSTSALARAETIAKLTHSAVSALTCLSSATIIACS